MAPLTARAEVLQKAEFFAIMRDSEKGGFAERYKLLRETEDLMDDVEKAQKKCVEGQR